LKSLEKYSEITLELPGDTLLPVIVGKWRRVDGKIIAWYTRIELAWALAVIGNVKLLERYGKKEVS